MLHDRLRERERNPWTTALYLSALSVLMASTLIVVIGLSEWATNTGSPYPVFINSTPPDPSRNSAASSGILPTTTPTPSTSTPSPTPITITVVVPPTITPRPQEPICDWAKPGEICRVYPPATTPAPSPTVPACAVLTPILVSGNLCVKADGGTYGGDSVE